MCIVALDDYEKEITESKKAYDKQIQTLEKQNKTLEVKLAKSEEARTEYRKDAT